MEPLKMLADALGQISNYLGVFVQGWKSFYLPAEPFVFVFPFTLLASATLNNQAMDLRLPYDYYVYAIGLASTGLFSFLLKASGGGVFFGNANVRSDTLWSALQPTFFLRRPFKIKANASLSVDLTDLSAAGNTGQIVLVGWKAASAYAQG